MSSNISRIPLKLIVEKLGYAEGELIRFLAPRTVQAIINKLPIEGRAIIWQNEIYFKIPLDLEDGESQDFEKVGKKEYLEVRDPADVEKISTKKKRAWLDFRKDANKPKL